MIRTFIPCLALGLLLAGCATTATITPDFTKDKATASDSSLPAQYSQKQVWFIQYTINAAGERDGAVLTPNGRDRYNTLIGLYALQFQQDNQVLLVRDAGVAPYVDAFGNALWRMDMQHFEYFRRLSREYAKAGKSPDSVWLKIKNAIP